MSKFVKTRVEIEVQYAKAQENDFTLVVVNLDTSKIFIVLHCSNFGTYMTYLLLYLYQNLKHPNFLILQD